MMVGNEKPGIPWRDRDIRRLRRDIETLKTDPAMLAIHTHASAIQGGPVAHTVLTSIGTNTHAQIDTAITASTTHIAATAAHGATGAVVGTTNTQTLSAKTLTTPTLTTPIIASFVNATHDHETAGGGGQLAEGALSLTDVATANASTTAHGFLKKLDNDITHFMDGAGNWDTVKDSDLSTTDITTNNVTTAKHGFCPKASNVTTQFLRGDATWDTVKWG